MKTHQHRILMALPRLCQSPLVKDISILLTSNHLFPVRRVRMDSCSIYICTGKSDYSLAETDCEDWHMVERDSILSLSVSIDAKECAKAGLDPYLDVVLGAVERMKG